MSMNINLLEAAKQDLKASILLYKSKQYPQAVFYYQQSVEKAFKSLGLLMDIVPKDQLGKGIYGHKILMIYKELSQQYKIQVQELINGLEEKPTLKQFPFLKDIKVGEQIEHLQAFTNELDKIKGMPNAFSTKESIDEILCEILKTYNETVLVKISNDDICEFTKQTMDKIDTIVDEMPIPPNVKDKGDIKKGLAELKNDPNNIIILSTGITLIIKALPIIMFLFISFLFLAMIVYPHDVQSRYPNEDIKLTHKYNKHLPIVARLPELIEVQLIALKQLGRLNKVILQFKTL